MRSSKGPRRLSRSSFLRAYVYPRVIIRSIAAHHVRFNGGALIVRRVGPSGPTGPSGECTCDTLIGVKRSMNVSRCTSKIGALFVPGFIIIIVLADTEARRL